MRVQNIIRKERLEFLKVIILYGIELGLVFFFEVLVSNTNNYLGLGDFRYIYYLYAFITFIPFIAYFLNKKQEMFSPIKLVDGKRSLNLYFIAEWFLPIFPAILFSILLVSFHADYYIGSTVLAGVLLIYTLIAAIIWFLVYFVSKKDTKVIALAVVGFILAVLFIQSNNLQAEFALLVVVEGILIPLIPTFFSSLSQLLADLFKKNLAEYILEIESLFVASLIALLLAALVSNSMIPNTYFKLLALTKIELVYIFLMSVGLALLFLALVGFLRIIYKLIRYLRTDSLNIVRDNMQKAISNLPLQIGEHCIEAESLKPLLTGSVHWWDKQALDSNIKAGLKLELLPEDSKIIVDNIIKKFVDNLSELAPKLIKEYILLYEELNKKANGNKRIIVAILNVIRGYNLYYWPNIDREMKKDTKMRETFDLIMRSIEKKQIGVDKYKQLLAKYNTILSYIKQIDETIGKL